MAFHPRQILLRSQPATASSNNRMKKTVPPEYYLQLSANACSCIIFWLLELLLLQPVSCHLFMKVFDVDASVPGSTAHVSIVHPEQPGKIFFFKPLNNFGLGLSESIDIISHRRLYDVFPAACAFEVDFGESISLFHDYCPLNNVLQFPDIPGIGVMHKRR